MFSGGGPSDELQFYVTPDLKFRYAEYRYKDWFDGASIRLTGDDAKLAQNIWENQFEETGVAQHERDKVIEDR